MKVILGALAIWLLARGRFHTYLALATESAATTPETASK